MIIGLTGAYCAGKNHIAALLEARGLPVLDVDKLGYQALESEKDAIFTLFGSELKRDDGSLDRRLLGKLVFGSAEELAKLEAIVHPAANRLTEEWIGKQNKSCVINAALLHRSSIFSKLDYIILVTAPVITRFFRAKRRDKLSFGEIIKRFKSQKDFYNQYLSINSSPVYAEIYRIENPGLKGGRKLERRIDTFLKQILPDKEYD
ncbi:MAG: dephospho-CoA kinase [Treponema sp.]|nr:dephospho-CoA kinase [Treponema sp.]